MGEQPTVTAQAVTPDARRSNVVTPPHGARVGRYIVLEPIAHGGMGSVMLAYDTQLARRVALKTLLTTLVSDEGRDRMVREAQAMARLSHPNVVTVHDFGVHEGNVFIAMEYVDGVTFREWLNEPRSWREVLQAMRQAARGLAAAHDAGVVHRDFKPANVIVAGDGRVCVVDFGIARGVRDIGSTLRTPSSVPPLPDGSTEMEVLLEHTLTEEGALLGTIGYAAPELLLGEETDARADVFSFSVTMWRALYGEMPFASERLDAYVDAVLTAQPAPPVRANVPHWLHEVVARGLASEPSARFASMDQMLRALDADPRKRHAAVAAAVGVVAVLAAAAAGKAQHDAAIRASCAAEGAEILGAWNAGRDAARKAMLTEGDRYAGERTEFTLQRLDDYAHAWAAEQTGSCLATRMQRRQPAFTHDKRTECLLDGRMQFEVALQTLGGSSPRAHKNSISIANRLPAVRFCSAPNAEKMSLRLPTDPEARRRSLAARRELARARDQIDTGELAAAKEVIDRVRSEARAAADPLLEATADLDAGWLALIQWKYDDGLESCLNAVARAESLGADHLVGMAASTVAFVLRFRLKKPDEARPWQELARAKVARLGEDPLLEYQIAESDANFKIDQDARAGLEAHARAVDMARRVFGENDRRFCAALSNHGFGYQALGDPSTAGAWYRQAIECGIRTGGPHHDGLGLYLDNLATVHLELQRWEDALTETQQGIDVREALNPRDKFLTVLLSDESRALSGLGRYPDAERDARRAIDIGGHNLDYAWYALGISLAGRGDMAGARDACARAVKEQGTPRPSEVYSRDAFGCLGEAELALGEVAAARGHLEQSLALPKRFFAPDLDGTRFALARALVASAPGVKPDAERALTVAREARDDLRAALGAYPFLQKEVDAVERWLAERAPARP